MVYRVLYHVRRRKEETAQQAQTTSLLYYVNYSVFVLSLRVTPCHRKSEINT